MSLKVKLISTISLFMLMLGALILGVFAATQQQISIQGNLSFVVPDRSLFVKEVRYQEAGGEEIVVDSFTPGYINGNFNMDLTSLETEENGHGSFILYFDIINTTDSYWAIESVNLGALANDGVSERHSGIIGVNELTDADDDGFKEFDPATTQADGTLELTIMAPNSDSIDLGEIVITIEEALSVTAISTNETLGTATGGGVVEIGQQVALSANFTDVDGAAFLGWRAGSETGELVSTLTDYNFTFTENSPTTYYAIFETANSNLKYSYTTSPGTARVSDCNTSATGELVTPSTIYRTSRSPYEFSVTSIGDGAFWGCSSLASITIPEGVTSIGNVAFYNCNSLTSITIPSSVTSIGSGAFYNCSNLTSITIPEGVTSIGWNAFRNCSSLERIIIAEGVTIIDGATFYGCSGLTEITIPEGVTNIYGQAFQNCSSLTSIEIPEGVTSIGDRAFGGCSSLKSITIPTTVTGISSEAFSGCSGLETITVEEGNTVYHSAGNCIIETESKVLVAGCKNSIIPSDGSVTSIGAYAFRDCSSLTSITIPEGVTSIGREAFYGCGRLTAITFNTPYNWEIASSSSFSDSSIIATSTASEVQTNALTYLTDTYYNRYWRAIVE